MSKIKLNAASALPLLTAMIWGLSFVAQRVGASTMQPFGFNAVRSIGAAVFLLSASAVYSKAKIRKYGRQKSEGDKKALLCGGILCGLFLSVGINLQQAGVYESGAGKAGFISALYVVLVPLFGFVLKKPVSRLVMLSVGVAVCGLYLLCINEDFRIERSDFLLLCCAFMFAAQIMTVDYFVQKTDWLKLSCVQFIVVAVVSGLLMLFFEEPPSLEAIRLSALPLLYTGIFSSGIAYTLQIAAQRRIQPTVLSLTLSLESVFSAIFGALILHERLTPRELCGCFLMLAAVVLSQLPSGKGEEPKES